MVNINNTQILFKLIGKCEVKNGVDGSTYLIIYNYDNMFCYQGWDLLTYELNGCKRKTFTIPVSQFVNAVNYYNSVNNNKYTPALVMRSEGNTTVVTMLEAKIKPYSAENPIETLMIKIKQNYENPSNKHTNLLVNPTSVSGSDIKHNTLCELMISELRFTYLNFNHYLTDHNIPFLLSEQDISGRDLSDMLHMRGLNTTNWNYLYEDKGKVEKTSYGLRITIKNPQSLIAYQGWNEESPKANYRIKRLMERMSAGKFAIMFNQVESVAKKNGLWAKEFGFQPTCLMTFNKNYKNTFVGVLKSFKLDANLNTDLDDNFPTLVMDISFKQIDHTFSGHKQYINPKGLGDDMDIAINIDALTTANATASGYVDKTVRSDVNKYLGTEQYTHEELCKLQKVEEQAIATYNAMGGGSAGESSARGYIDTMISGGGWKNLNPDGSCLNHTSGSGGNPDRKLGPTKAPSGDPSGSSMDMGDMFGLMIGMGLAQHLSVSLLSKIGNKAEAAWKARGVEKGVSRSAIKAEEQGTVASEEGMAIKAAVEEEKLQLLNKTQGSEEFMKMTVETEKAGFEAKAEYAAENPGATEGELQEAFNEARLGSLKGYRGENGESAGEITKEFQTNYKETLKAREPITEGKLSKPGLSGQASEIETQLTQHAEEVTGVIEANEAAAATRAATSLANTEAAAEGELGLAEAAEGVEAAGAVEAEEAATLARFLV